MCHMVQKLFGTVKMKITNRKIRKSIFILHTSENATLRKHGFIKNEESFALFIEATIGCKYICQNFKLQLNISTMFKNNLSVSIFTNKSRVFSELFKSYKQLR